MEHLPSSFRLPHEGRVLGQAVQSIVFDLVVLVGEQTEYLG